MFLAAIVAVAALSGLGLKTAQAKYASLVMDADTGEVIHEVNADTRNYPASLTKMMTLYMVFQALDEGRLSLNDKVTISARAARQPASHLGLRKGETLNVKQAILAIVTKSANDVAAAIAEHLAGSERKFAMRATAMAHKLGMSRTTFRNASGLPHRGQLSTARDMATLSRRLITDFPGYYHYFSTANFTFRGTRYKNHNKMLRTYDGADGIKTGYIRASGFNLVASAKRGDRRLIGVVFGSRSSGRRNYHMARLLDKGFAALGVAAIAKKARPAKKPAKRATARNTAPRNRGAKTGRWGIQVGAYRTYDPAYEIAVRAQEKAPNTLKNGYIKVVPLKKARRRTLFRGRILGISRREAYRACRILKRRKMPCMELRMKKDYQLATREG